MGTLTSKQGEYEFLWASDITFDGIRLEVYDQGGKLWFEVSVPDEDDLAVNTFSREVPAELLLSAMSIARART